MATTLLQRWLMAAMFASASCVASAQTHVAARVPASDVELKYVREGSGPVLLVIGSSVYYPRAFSNQLRDQFDLVFADCRHFVPSYRPAPAELAGLILDSFVEDVESARRSLGIERLALPGHSVHAQIAVAYAAEDPARVSRLILLAGVPYPFSELASAQEQLWASADLGRRDAMAANQAKL